MYYIFFSYLCIMKPLLALLFLLLALSVAGQGARSWEPLLAQIMTADDMASAEWEDTYQLLSELEQHPLNLNTATRYELESLPFLSSLQVEAIVEYRSRYGALKSMNELRMIRPLDHAQIQLLPFFTYIDSRPVEETFPQLSDVLKYGRHELMGNVRIPFYRRKGDDNGYLGYPYRHWLRYQFSYRDDVKIGGVASQDAGEPFFSNRNAAGYDFYSYYLQVRHWGPVENAVVGKYKLSVGMGLVLNNSFSLGKVAMLQQLGRNTNTIRPHSSLSQTGFFQGAAATIRLSPQLLLTAFASYRPFDATLNDDGTMRTILTDGYHRTPAEMQKKHNSHATDAGAHLAYRQKGFHAGLTALYTHFDRELVPQTTTLYRRHYAQGRDFLNFSADYGYQSHRFALNGETAVNRHGALATINSLSLTAADGLNVMLLQRFYGYRYTALYARSLSEGGHVQNESAVYLGATWQPSPRLRLQAYTDYAYFAWARYQVSQSSYAWDNLLSATYQPNPWTLSGRYRLRLRQKDATTAEDADNPSALITTTEHRGRLTLSWQQGNLSITTQGDGVLTGGRHYGYMVNQVAAYQRKSLKVCGSLGYFNTDSYDARIYVYEHNPLYNFSFPSFYGEGLRLTLMVQGKAGNHLTLTAKTGLTRYFDRSAIGSGLQEVSRSTTTDLDLQVRWQF
jgi:hypothetical protein